jgi:hypothetical protein
LRLSDQVAQDKAVLDILPVCFDDGNCKKEGSNGICQDAGSINARCSYSLAGKVSLLVISPERCRTCDTDSVVVPLKKELPGLVVSYLAYPGDKAEAMIRDFGIRNLPVYFLGKEVEKEPFFIDFQRNLELKGGFYMVKAQVSGISYFLNRPVIEERLDLFMNLFAKDSFKLLNTVKEFNPVIHFLVTENDGVFTDSLGGSDIEESMRSVCVQKYYPGFFWQYISCRANNPGSAWWDDCLENLDTKVIKDCAKTQEGSELLRQNIALNKELEITKGPTYLLDNREIFASVEVPAKEEFRKVISGK